MDKRKENNTVYLDLEGERKCVCVFEREREIYCSVICSWDPWGSGIATPDYPRASTRKVILQRQIEILSLTLSFLHFFHSPLFSLSPFSITPHTQTHASTHTHALPLLSTLPSFFLHRCFSQPLSLVLFSLLLLPFLFHHSMLKGPAVLNDCCWEFPITEIIVQSLLPFHSLRLLQVAISGNRQNHLQQVKGSRTIVFSCLFHMWNTTLWRSRSTPSTHADSFSVVLATYLAAIHLEEN